MAERRKPVIRATTQADKVRNNPAKVGQPSGLERPMPAEDPAGKLMEMISSLGDPGNWEAGPAQAVAHLLSPGQKLNNLLNHTEDLKGTPFEKAFDYLGEKFPHVFGNVRMLTSNPGKMPFTTSGQYQNSPAHFNAATPKRGLPVGDIHMNPDSSGKWFGSDPVEALTHEGVHAAQSLGEGPHLFDDLYKAETKRVGYDRNKYEVSARRVGKKQKKLARRAPK